MTKLPESLRTFCRRIARAATSEDGAEAIRLLQLTGLMGRVDGVGARPPDDDADLETSGRVGIWERRQENGKSYFARRVDMIEDWNYWANLGRIEAKTGRRRVVFIGESVARGYLYDPQFTPAMALQKILESRLGEGEVEVIDLARTNLGLEVRELALAALQLEPDAVVLFSGNNWTMSYPSRSQELVLIDSALREQGLAGLKRFIEDQLASNVARVVRDVSSRYQARNIPVVWLVPEFNLGDWRDPVTNAPYLPAGANREWIEAWRQARAALDGDDLERAEHLAQRMTELDRGLSIAGLYVLTECRRRCGDREGERRYLERARDAVLWDPSRSTSPRTYSIARTTLRREAGRFPDQVVDVPEIFRDYLEEAIPDRRMFIDYCHLTSEGILVTMAAAASAVLRALDGREVPWRDLVDESLAPSPEVEAEAAFLAAVHNAHWWQSYDLVRHYCHRAVDQSPAIAKVMTRFIDVQTRTTPMLMGRAAQEIVELGSPLIQHYLLRYNNQQLDELLLDAVVDALQRVEIDAGERLASLRLAEHSITRGRTNLLNYYYNSAALQPQEIMWSLPPRQGWEPRIGNDYYRAYWLESRFVFLGEAGQPARLALTCRLPDHAREKAQAVLEVNGHEQVRLEVDRSWSSWEIPLGGEALVDGLNRITLHWPMPEFPGESELERVVDYLVDGIYPEFFCAFGEIHEFTVDGRQPDPPVAR